MNNTITKDIANAYDDVIKKAKSSAEWYTQPRKIKKNISKIIRASSIVLIGVGGLFPIIGVVSYGEGNTIDLSNGGYYTIAVAGILLFLDKFFGFSSGWIRYITTEMEIRRQIDLFEIQWEIERSKTALCPDTDFGCERATELLQMLKDFTAQIGQLVKQETESWASEFQDSIMELQKLADSKAKSQKPGDLSLTISNYHTLTDKTGLTVSIQGRDTQHIQGEQVLIRNLSPGNYHLQIKRNNTVINTMNVSIAAGEMTGKIIELTDATN